MPARLQELSSKTPERRESFRFSSIQRERRADADATCALRWRNVGMVAKAIFSRRSSAPTNTELAGATGKAVASQGIARVTST